MTRQRRSGKDVGRLAGRVAIVTGAGRGLGRSHAHRLAADGASVVVNDLGVDASGSGHDWGPAETVVEEIRDAGGAAVPSNHDVANWAEASELIALAVSEFGDLHALVNNAGVLRDRTLANMTEREWDEVVRIDLKGHAAPTRHALAYWRTRAAENEPVRASIVHTTSIAAFTGNVGQANYAAAKLAVVALSRVASLEGSRYGVRSNVIAPSARTRLSTGVRGREPAGSEDAVGFDVFDPANVSPLVSWLASADCPADSQIFYIYGRRLMLLASPHIVYEAESASRWAPEELDRALSGRLKEPLATSFFLDLWMRDGQTT